MNRNIKLWQIVGLVLSIAVVALLVMGKFMYAVVLSQFVLWMGCTMQMKKMFGQKKYKEAKRFQAFAYLCALLFTAGAIVLWI